MLQKVAEYATSSSGLSEEIPSIETIINMDFFNQNADINRKTEYRKKQYEKPVGVPTGSCSII